ncbi:MAG: AlbA family DNA-binding domain-containing protein, partial [Tannerellaceae bacterium]
EIESDEAYISFDVVGEESEVCEKDGIFSYFIVTNGELTHRVKKFFFQNNRELPQRVHCRVTMEDGVPVRLQQDFGTLFCEVYEENKAYDFQVEAVVETEKGYYYRLRDGYGFWHKLYSRRALKWYSKDDRIRCVVCEMEPEKAYMQLYEETYFEIYGAIDTEEELLRVVDVHIENEDERYYVAQRSESGEVVRVRMFPFQYDMPHPEDLLCSVVQDEDAPLSFVQARRHVVREYYEVEKQYPFSVHKIVDRECRFYVLYDEFGFSHHLYDVGNRFDLTVGDEVQCTVKFFKDDCNSVHLMYYEEDSIVGVFISASQLFDEIGLPHFYEPYFEMLRLEAKTSKSAFLRKVFHDHDLHHNLWIFSYLNFYKFAKMDKEEELRNVIEICMKIDEWILESGFLKSFSSAKRVEVIKKAEAELRKCKAQRKALDLIKANEHIAFAERMAKMLDKGGHVMDGAEKIETLRFVITFSPAVLHKHLQLFLRLFSLLINYELVQENQLSSFAGLLYNYVNDIEVRCTRVHGVTPVHTMPKEVLLNSILILCARILLLNSIGKTRSLTFSFSILSRYLYAYTGHRLLLDVGLRILTKGAMPDLVELFSWSDVCDAKIDRIEEVVCRAGELEPVRHAVLYNQSSVEASVELINGSVVCFSKYMNCNRSYAMEQSRSASFLSDLLHVAGGDGLIPDLCLQGSLEDVRTYWSEFSKVIYGGKRTDTDSKVVCLRFNNVYNMQRSFGSFTIMEGVHKGQEGVLSATEVLYADSLDEIFSPGDEVYCTLKEYDEKKRSFVLSLDNCQRKIRDRLEHRYKTRALLLRNKGLKLVWLTEEGLICKSKARGNVYMQDETYVVVVDKLIADNLYPIVEVVEVAREKLCDREVRNRFIKNELCISSSSPQLAARAEEVPDKFFVKEVVIYLYYALEHSTDLREKYSFAQLAFFLSKLISDRTQNYFVSLVNFIDELEMMRKGKESEFFLVKGYVLYDFPMLEELSEALILMTKVGRNGCNELLQREARVNEACCDAAGTQGLVLAYNMIKDTAVAEHVKQELLLSIYRDLAMRVLGVDADSLHDVDGVEEVAEQIVPEKLAWAHLIPSQSGDSVELKKSAVLLDDGSRVAKVLQMSMLMRTVCSFLNGQGGRIFIGVDVDGRPIGLEDDLRILKVSLIDYRRLLHQSIVDFFGCDVNGEVRISTPEFEGLTYCVIEVPEYPEPVTYKKEYWVRQGDENRMLTGEDLVLFVKRKLKLKQELNTPAITEVAEVVETSGSVELALYHLCFFTNGKYGMFSEPLTSMAVRYQFPIETPFSEQEFVVLCYNNGYVNRVCVADLNKLVKDRPLMNGWNKEAKLVDVCFAESGDELIVEGIRAGKAMREFIPIEQLKRNSTCSAKGRRLFPKGEKIKIRSCRIR